MPSISILPPGSRSNLHPMLSILDQIDCRVVYDRSVKCIFVDYDYDPITKTYRKGTYTTRFQSVIDDIKEFFNKNANVQ